jgi:xylulokinase
LTGGLPLTTTSAAKLFWLKRHRGNLVDATHQFLLPKDFLRFKMTGEYATDPTDAGGTALLRAGGGASWSEEYLDEILEVPPEKLPSTRRCSAPTCSRPGVS